jgi:hypothetical protein
MKTCHVHYYFVAIIGLFTACSTSLISISVLEPASFSLPASIKSVSIFPEVIFSDSPGVFDSIQCVELDPTFNYNKIKKGYLLGLYDAMIASPVFRRVVIADSSYKQLTTPDDLIRWNDLVQICNKDSTNSVAILTKAVSYDNIQFYSDLDMDCSFYYQVINKTKWSFLLPELKTEATNFTYHDTVYFEGRDYDCGSILNDMPSGNELLYDACYKTGYRVGTYISPSWNDDVQRIVFTGPNRGLRNAAILLYKDQWGEAARIWNHLSEAKNRKLASRASFNIALAFERDDNLDQAASWIAYADSMYSNGRTLKYKKLLDVRLKTRTILDKQMTGVE